MPIWMNSEVFVNLNKDIGIYNKKSPCTSLLITLNSAGYFYTLPIAACSVKAPVPFYTDLYYMILTYVIRYRTVSCDTDLYYVILTYVI